MVVTFDREAQAKRGDSPPPLEAASDLAAEAFIRIRDLFFTDGFTPIPFDLRHKRDTQDDPLDEMIAEKLAETLSPGMAASKATGPLITPDMALYRPTLCNGATLEELRTDSRRAVGIEVKRLKPSSGGEMARTSGMDFNSTPPCGTARIYTLDNRPIDIPSFYLFVFECPADNDMRKLTMMAMCDGNLLNEDFQLYLQTTGTRNKEIELGTYGDGANRNRPMMIFTNPFTSTHLADTVTLVHRNDGLHDKMPDLLEKVGTMSRTRSDGTKSPFHVYRHKGDVRPGHNGFDATDPFKTPKRKAETAQRGRFKIDVKPRH